MRRIKSKKKGVAPLVATVLLVSLTIVLAAIIYFWVKGFIAEQIEKFGQSADETCKLISFDADIVQDTAADYYLDVTNTGNIPINEVDLKKAIGADTSVERIEVGLGTGDSTSKQISDMNKVNTVTVIPVLLGTVKGTSNMKSFKCAEDLGKKIEVS